MFPNLIPVLTGQVKSVDNDLPHLNHATHTLDHKFMVSMIHGFDDWNHELVVQRRELYWLSYVDTLVVPSQKEETLL